MDSQTTLQGDVPDQCPSCLATLKDVPHEEGKCPHCGFQYADPKQGGTTPANPGGQQ